jgi:hypothetical protein
MIATEGRKPKIAMVSFHPALRFFAKVISYLFHPLFIPIYMGWFLIYYIGLFPDQDPLHKARILIQIIVSYTFLPIVAVLLMKALGFVNTIHLKTSKDRIIPFVVCEICFFWAWYVFKNLLYPKEMILFGLGVFLTSCIGLIVNGFKKASLHAMSMGVVCAFMIIASFMSDQNFGFYISTAFLIAGIVCTSRLILNDHTPSEVYTGFFIGVAGEVIAWCFI